MSTAADQGDLYQVAARSVDGGNGHVGQSRNRGQFARGFNELTAGRRDLHGRFHGCAIPLYMWLPRRWHAKSIEDAAGYFSASSLVVKNHLIPRNSGRTTEQVTLGSVSVRNGPRCYYRKNLRRIRLVTPQITQTAWGSRKAKSLYFCKRVWRFSLGFLFAIVIREK